MRDAPLIHLTARPFLLCALSLANSTLLAEVNFDVTFEPGSRWFSDPNARASHALIERYFRKLGAVFSANATVTVLVTDDLTGPGGPGARGGPISGRWRELPGREGIYFAGAPRLKILEGLDPNGGNFDARIDFNIQAYSEARELQPGQDLFGGNADQIVIHESIHFLGCTGFLMHDRRGSRVFATIHDGMIVDARGAGLLKDFDERTSKFTLRHYSYVNQPSIANSSGLRFPGRWADGSVRSLRFRSGKDVRDFVDFHHFYPSFYTANEDRLPNEAMICYLRGLGYPIKLGVFPKLRPDLLLGNRRNTRQGDNRYNQSLSLKCRSKTSRAYFAVENDDVKTRTTSVTATLGSRRDIRVNYYSKRRNVTAALTGRGMRSSLNYRAEQKFTLRVNLGRSKMSKSVMGHLQKSNSLAFRIRAVNLETSQSDSGLVRILAKR